MSAYFLVYEPYHDNSEVLPRVFPTLEEAKEYAMHGKQPHEGSVYPVWPDFDEVVLWEIRGDALVRIATWREDYNKPYPRQRPQDWIWDETPEEYE